MLEQLNFHLLSGDLTNHWSNQTNHWSNQTNPMVKPHFSRNKSGNRGNLVNPGINFVNSGLLDKSWDKLDKFWAKLDKFWGKLDKSWDKLGEFWGNLVNYWANLVNPGINLVNSWTNLAQWSGDVFLKLRVRGKGSFGSAKGDYANYECSQHVVSLTFLTNLAHNIRYIFIWEYRRRWRLAQ